MKDALNQIEPCGRNISNVRNNRAGVADMLAIVTLVDLNRQPGFRRLINRLD